MFKALATHRGWFLILTALIFLNWDYEYLYFKFWDFGGESVKMGIIVQEINVQRTKFLDGGKRPLFWVPNLRYFPSSSIPFIQQNNLGSVPPPFATTQLVS